MDSLLVNELANHYKERVLRFTPKIFNIFGVHKNSVSLKLEGQSVACIPYELSVGTATLLAILNDRESSHFNELTGAPAKLVVIRWYKDESNPETFHIPVHLGEFQRPNPDSAYCLARVRVDRLPHELKELLVTYFFDMDQADAFISHLKVVPFREDDVQAVLGSRYLSLQKDKAIGEKLKILEFTVKTVKVFGEISGAVPVVGERLELLPYKGDRDCSVEGVCREVKTYPDLPDFFQVILDQTLGVETVKKLMKHTKKVGTAYLNLD